MATVAPTARNSVSYSYKDFVLPSDKNDFLRARSKVWILTHALIARYAYIASRDGYRGVLTQQAQIQFVRAQDCNIKLRGAARKYVLGI